MGVLSYPEEERTVHHGQNRASPSAKFFRFTCQVMLLLMVLAVLGGIVVGLISFNFAMAPNSPEKDDTQARNLFARSYYGNVTAPGNVNPTGTAPVSMNNFTVVMNTASGAVPSVSSPSLTLTVDDVGTVSAAEASTEVDVPVVNATITLTSTSTTVTNTRTITQTGAAGATSVDLSSGESNTSVVFSESASDCVPATVTLTVTETLGGVASAQMTSTSQAVAPFTTLIIPDLYSKVVKGGQSPLSSQALNATTETAAIQEATETPAANNNLTTTVTVFEQPTVVITSTTIADNATSSTPAIPTGPADTEDNPCMSENVTAAATPSMATVTLSKVVTETYTTTLDGSATLTTGARTIFETEIVGVEQTVFATGTVGALNNTMTALKTITVLPANPTTPEATQTASSNGTSPVVVSEATPSKQGKRGGGTVTGCVVMVTAAILCML